MSDSSQIDDIFLNRQNIKFPDIIDTDFSKKIGKIYVLNMYLIKDTYLKTK